MLTGAIPPTGIPLPFISAGGSGLVVFMSAIGVLLNIANNDKSFVKNKTNIFPRFKHKSLHKI